MYMPKYVMVSSEIRRDLEQPLQLFHELEIHHFYNRASWGDMRPEDFGPRTKRFSSPWNLYRRLVEVQPDIIQGPEPFSLLMLPYVLAVYWFLLKHPKVQLITMSQETIPLHRKYGRGVAAIFKPILRRWFLRATLILWLDQSSYKNMLDFKAPPEKLVYLLYGCWGVNLNEFNPFGKRYDFGKSPTILFVGRLVKEKGVQYLIEAYRRIRLKGTEATLAIIGDGIYRAELEKQAKDSGFSTDISFLGTQKHSSLPSYLRGATVLALPSISAKIWVQHISMIPWFAMACGVPVVVTDTGQMREYTPDGVGIMVREHDVDGLSNALHEIITNPVVREHMSKAAVNYAINTFNINDNVRKAEQTILKACGYR